ERDRLAVEEEAGRGEWEQPAAVVPVLEHDVPVLEAGHRAAEAARRVLHDEPGLGHHLGHRAPVRPAGQYVAAVGVLAHAATILIFRGKSRYRPSECRPPGRLCRRETTAGRRARSGTRA